MSIISGTCADEKVGGYLSSMPHRIEGQEVLLVDLEALGQVLEPIAKNEALDGMRKDEGQGSER